MKIQCQYKDGTFGFIPGVKWHQHGVVHECLYILKDKLDSHLSEHGRKLEDIQVVEAPIQIFRSDFGDHPWLAHGSLICYLFAPERTDPEWWDQH